MNTMRGIAGLTFGAILFAQEGGPGFSRGTLIAADAGFLEVRDAAGATLRCGFDSRTWIERDSKRVQMNALEAGVPVEVLTDIRAGRCYTRTIRLVSSLTAPVARRITRPPTRSVLENIFPRGNLTFAGVVIRRSPTTLVVRTRTEPEKIIALRQDTRYLDSGAPATAADVAVNTRVFIRGGKSFENELEAYQVIWGEIAGPSATTSY